MPSRILKAVPGGEVSAWQAIWYPTIWELIPDGSPNIRTGSFPGPQPFPCLSFQWAGPLMAWGGRDYLKIIFRPE